MVFRFGVHELDTQRHELRREGRAVHVRPKVFELLRYLVTHNDRALSKQDLIDALWPDQAVSDSVLTTAVRDARDAVGDTGSAQQVIQTVHGHGYRFVAAVHETSPLPPPDHSMAVDEPVLDDPLDGPRETSGPTPSTRPRARPSATSNPARSWITAYNTVSPSRSSTCEAKPRCRSSRS